MFDWVSVFNDPANWMALVTLIAMEVVLGIDNLLFISENGPSVALVSNPSGRGRGWWALVRRW